MHFLSATDLSRQQMEDVFGIADTINSGRHLSLDRMDTLALFFEEAVPRERVSLEIAMAMLNGSTMYVNASGPDANPARRLADAERELGKQADFVAALMLHQADIRRLADSLKVPVINILTDLERPLQALTDVYTIAGFRGSLKGIRIACIGNIAKNSFNSLMLAATELGAGISLVGPEGIAPNKECLALARKRGPVEVHENIEEGLSGADVVYTDVFWPGMAASGKVPKELMRYQLNRETLRFVNKDAIVMHPMPAARGKEATSEVLDGRRSVVWKETKNKVKVEQALIKYITDASY